MSNSELEKLQRVNTLLHTEPLAPMHVVEAGWLIQEILETLDSDAPALRE